jgi:integrase
VPLSKTVSEMLRDRHAQLNPKPESLTFPSPKNKALDDHNFNRRAWRTVLESVGVAYRSPYAIRHSAATLALENGANPTALAKQLGHDPRVLFSNYDHAIAKKSLFIEF